MPPPPPPAPPPLPAPAPPPPTAAGPAPPGVPARAALAQPAAVLAIAVAVVLAMAPPARADDLDEAVPLQRALSASREVLLLVPQAVHQDCVDALRELAATRETVEFDTRARGVHNLSVARDVLAADYDSAARSCGEDAARACAPVTTGARNATLATACGKMLPLPPP